MRYRREKGGDERSSMRWKRMVPALSAMRRRREPTNY